jgi:hypothetical protein
MLYYRVMCCISSCIYFRPHIFSIDTLTVHYVLKVSVVPPSSGMHIDAACMAHPFYCSMFTVGIFCANIAVQLAVNVRYLMMAKGPKHLVDN